MIEAAASHASHLMAQGLDPDVAIQHAVQRFAVSTEAVVWEIRSRHEFALAVGSDEPNEIVEDYLALETAAAWFA